MKLSHPRERIVPVAVRVRPGAIVWRHGRSWTGGQVLEVTPDDARRLIEVGSVRRVS